MAKQTWQNRIVGYGEEAPDQLLANPKNWRIHPKHQQDALAGVLCEVGVVQNVIVNQTTGHLVDGHLRVSLAIRDKQPTIPVTYVALTEAEEALVLATLDPLAAMAATDAEQLRALLDDVNTGEAAVMAMLSELAEREGVIDALGKTAGLTDPDEVPEPPALPITQPGDLWLLGRHRLLCGDSTKADAVKRLVDGQRLNMMFTDPPYGVAYAGSKNAKILGDLTQTAIPLSFKHAIEIALDADARFYLCGGSGNAPMYWSLFDAFCHQAPSMIIWVKESFVMRPNNYHSQFEVLYFGWKGKGGALSHWYGDRKSSDVWQIRRDKVAEYLHPTQKPVEIPAKAIQYSCPPGGTVYEPFGGSGSTLIACEQEGRRCAVIELDPKYCDVIVQRWERFTGQTAVREPQALAAD